MGKRLAWGFQELLGIHNLCWVVYVNLTQARIIREESFSWKKKSSKDLPVRHFPNYGSVGVGPEHCVGGAIPGLVILGFVGR